MSNDEDWRRQRAEEIFGPGKTPWSTSPPRRAKGDDDGVFPIPMPPAPVTRPAAAPPVNAPPVTAPAGKAVEPPRAKSPVLPVAAPPAPALQVRPAPQVNSAPPVNPPPVNPASQAKADPLPSKSVVAPAAVPPAPVPPAKAAPRSAMSGDAVLASPAVTPSPAAAEAVVPVALSVTKRPATSNAVIETAPPATAAPSAPVIAAASVIPVAAAQRGTGAPRWIKVGPPVSPAAESSVLSMPAPPMREPVPALAARSTMRWWPLAAVAVLLFAGVLSWLLFQPRTGPTLVAAAPSAAPQPSVAVVPAAVERQPEAVASAEPLPAPPTVIVPDETVSDAPVVSTMPERPSMIDPLAPRTAAARDRSPRAVSTATVLTPPMEPPVRADAPPRSTEPARADLATRVEPPPRVDPAKTRAPVAAARNDIDVRAVAPKAATLPSRAVAAPARADARTSSVRPSFNCRRSRGDVARAICRDDELAGLDRAVAGRFAALAAGIDSGVVQAIHHGQTAFLNDRQNCTDRDCLVEVYRNRLRELDELAH